jgi:hypothetical protein
MKKGTQPFFRLLTVLKKGCVPFFIRGTTA